MKKYVSKKYIYTLGVGGVEAEAYGLPPLGVGAQMGLVDLLKSQLFYSLFVLLHGAQTGLVDFLNVISLLVLLQWYCVHVTIELPFETLCCTARACE